MKPKIHPKYHDVMVTCACGESFRTRSTNPELRLEICSKCHPFFTGKQKLIDSAGRVERFKNRYRNVSMPGQDKKKDGSAAAQPPATAPSGAGSPAPADSSQS
jgi:large subunit ribosomal protein L31